MDKKGKHQTKSWRRAGSKPKKRSLRGDRSRSNTSASAIKLKESKDDSFDVRVKKDAGYSIIQFFFVFSLLEQYLSCKVCKGDVSFSKFGQKGFGFKIHLECKCGEKLIESCSMINNGFEINRRLVFVFRLLGVGLQGLNLFCGLLEMGPGLNKVAYYSIVETIKTAVKAVFDVVRRKAIDEEKKLNAEAGNGEDLTVSGDGSWAKRGFSSLIGLVTLIGKYSKKVLDAVVLSSYCKACELWKKRKDDIGFAAWYEKHKGNCDANHEGSSGKMEVSGIVKMFMRSLEKYAVRYGFYIGDGDSKTFKMLLETFPYGENVTVKKLECVLHVAKRIFKRASEAKKTLTQRRKAETAKRKAEEKQTKEVKKTSSKKKTAAKKRKTDSLPKVKTVDLTIKLMKELSTNYGLAVQRNKDSVEGMRNEIWAGFYHKISTDSKPQHQYCPAGESSWCKYRKAEAKQTLKDFKHPPALSEDVQEVLKPIYEDLTKDELLERCLGGNTQNNNESFNATVWSMAPKHTFSGKKIVKIACLTAACIFNEGFSTVLKIMETMHVGIGETAVAYAATRDRQRIQVGNRRSSEASKEGRTMLRQKRLEESQLFEQSEGILYGPGIAD